MPSSRGEENKKGYSESDSSEPRAYSDADFEDLKAPNAPQSRLFVPTTKIEPSPLNNKRINIRVTEGLLKSGGVFSASYLLFTVHCEPVGWTI